MRRVLSLSILLCLAATTAFAQDPVKVDAKHYKVLLENDSVRVLSIKYKAKGKSVMHEHPASVVVFLSDYHTKFNLPDQTTTDNSGKAGEFRFADAGKHLPENVGDTTLEAVLVELKDRPAAAATTITLDPVKVDPEHHKLEFENDRVRVIRVNFKPHEKTKEHEHPRAVAVFLTDVKSKFTLPDGKTREGGGKRGQVTWIAGERHIVEDMSSKPAEIILVELK
jgi:quercetin dioxygenase-like cupin family protein